MPAGAFSQAQPSNRGSGLGGGAMMLAVAAFLIAWIPFLGLLMLLPAALAGLLGVISFGRATFRGDTRRGAPVLAVLAAAATFVVAPASSLVGVAFAGPWMIGVAADNAQVELESALRDNGLARSEAERIGQEVGDVLRGFAPPDQWRDGIEAMHRLEVAMDDYERFGDSTGDLVADLQAVASRYGADLSPSDVEAIVVTMRMKSQYKCETPVARPSGCSW
jgi:hypothetical protein